MRRLLPFFTAGSLLLPSLASASTWRVTHDPDHPDGRVAAAVAGAASGDSILIDPGTYYEHISLDGKSLLFLASGAPGSAILDGSKEANGSIGSILYDSVTHAIHLHVEGLVFQHGQGTPWGLTKVVGGAIALVQEHTAVDISLFIRNCTFKSNVMLYSLSRFPVGGAIFLDSAALLDVENSSFEDNRTEGSGGTIAGSLHQATISNCQFEFVADGMTDGYVIWCYDLTNFLLDRCTFTSSGTAAWPPDDMNAISLITKGATLTHNRFWDEEIRSATNVLIASQAPASEAALVVVTDNVFCNTSPAGPGNYETGLQVSPILGAVTLERNSISGCFVSVIYGGGSAPTCRNNIFHQSPVLLDTYHGATVSCNCSWPDTTFGPATNLTLIDNIHKNPLFCNPTEGDLQLADTSPCAEEYAPAGCGRIGALGIACTDTPVQRMSWGRLKSIWARRR